MKLEEQIRLALTGGESPKTPAQGIVFGWRAVKWCKENPHLKPSDLLQVLEGDTANLTRSYIEKALSEWKPEMFIELAREMKKHEKNIQADTVKWALLEASKQGPVNLSQLKAHADKELIQVDLRTWRRTAHKLGLKTAHPGQPKK